MTPIDDEDPGSERAFTELRVVGDDLDPEALTSRLALQPSSTQRKGEVLVDSPGLQRTAETGGWFLSSEGVVKSRDLPAHLDWLLGQLATRAAELASIRQELGVTMSIYCDWRSPGGGGFWLWPQQMRTMADLDLEFQVALSLRDDESAP